MQRLRRSFVISGLERYATLGLNLTLMAVLARLLTPEETGVFLVGAAVVAITETLKDFGASAHIVQVEHASLEVLRTTTTITFCLSAGLGLALVAGAAPLALFYGDPRIAPVIEIGAAGIVLTSLATPVVALLRRELAFGAAATVNLAATALNVATAITLAALGFGFISLAWASLAGIIASVLVGQLVRPSFWVFRPCLAGWRSVAAFGGFATATSVLNTIHQTLPQLILGRIMGLDAVGLYGRAFLLCQLPERTVLSAFAPVVLPALAAQARAGTDLAAAYLHGLRLITAVHWPALVLVAILAEPIVAVSLGAQWMEAAPLLRLMALGSLALFPALLTWPMLVAVGRVRDTLTASLISLPASAAVLAAATPFGLEAVAGSMMLTAPLQALVAVVLVRRAVPFRWRELALAVRGSAIVALATAAVPLLAIALAGWQVDTIGPAGLAVVVPGAALCWLAAAVAVRHPLWTEIAAALRVAAERGRSVVAQRGLRPAPTLPGAPGP